MRVKGRHFKTVWFKGATVYLIDQNALPFKFRIHRCPSYKHTAAAIKNMTVRGAGAIGVAAGFAMAQGVLRCSNRLSAEGFAKCLRRIRRHIDSARPTARNLFYATEKVEEAAGTHRADIRRAKRAAVKAAMSLFDEDNRAARSIARIGERLIPSGAGILTHCNAGWLAFSDWGTALAPIYLAHRKHKKLFVYVDETRPRSQGARLTAWELGNENVPHAVIADTAAGCLMYQKKVQLVLVGADRIAANGDTANKIGTYSLAVLAKENKIPFYVAAPLSTIDMCTSDGSKIPIESRSGSELFDRRWFRCLKKSRIENPAFDVTPARYIRGIITERGIVRPNKSSLCKLFKQPSPRSPSGVG